MTNTKLAWWSGLTMAAPPAGIQAVRSELEHGTYDGQIYWYAEPPSALYGGDSAQQTQTHGPADLRRGSTRPVGVVNAA